MLLFSKQDKRIMLYMLIDSLRTPSNRDRLAQLGSFSTVATVLDESSKM